MNLSGEAVKAITAFYKIPMENVIVISDDIELDAGRLRIRRNGSHGGHNGLRNIIDLCGTSEFPRVKIGVGRKPHPEYDLADWVLGRFSEADLKALRARFDDIATASEMIVKGEIDAAMAKYSK
jgi:PTH1 family peptidyl-tRNA hydrolase